MVLYNLKVFGSDMKFKMAATAGLSLTLDPMGKMFQNASSLKPLGQLKPNCPGMIIGRSSTKFVFYMPIGNPRWPPPQYIYSYSSSSNLGTGFTRECIRFREKINIEPYGKMFKCLLLRNYKYD